MSQKINATATWYPQLDGLGLPRSLTNGMGQAYTFIYALRDATQQFSSSTNHTLDGIVQYGTHAARVAETNVVDRALYSEIDRGGVVYQYQNGHWHYLAGTMWGTISPDQRPTDLGVNDAGFDFRTSVAPRQEFIWSGTVWVEVTGLTDPTTTKGDLIVRSATALARLGTGTNGQVLTVNATAPLGVDWETPSGGGTGAVTSVFGRTGAVTAQPGDYYAGQITYAVDQSASYPNPAWITSLAWSKITGAPATGVASIFGRTGTVVAATGDYTAAQVTNAVSSIASYTDPSWITSLAWSKIAGAPAIFTDPTITKGDLIVHGTTTTRLPVGVDGQVLQADSTQALGVKWAAAASGVASVFGRTGAVVAAVGDYTAAQVTNAVSTVSTYADPVWITALGWTKITGAPSVSSYQTPWLSDINAAGFQLLNTGNIGIGTPAPQVRLDVNGSGVFRGLTAATSGQHLRIGFDTANHLADILSFDAGASSYMPLNLRGNPTYFTAGNVGIGTTIPGYLLTVRASAAATTNALAVENITTGVYGAGVVFRATDSVSASVYSTGRIYGVFDTNAFTAARLTLQNATGIDTFQDVLTIKNGQVGIGTISPGAQLDLSTDSARKLTTTTWATGSDIRIKQNIRELQGGLDIINQLRPVECEHNGLGGTVAGTRTISLIAQEVRPVLPGTVTSRRAKLHPGDAEETDILDFNPHECLFHLILAVQQLYARLT